MGFLTFNQQKSAAKAFAKRWEGKGDEKQDCQRFWTDLFISVFGIENPADLLEFEVPVKVNGHQKYKDVVIPSTHVLIEQKGFKIKDLNQKIRQSEGEMLTPYEQAQRYADNTNKDERPTWIITSNFQEFWVYDQNKMHEEPEKILLKNLEKDFPRLNFLVKDSNKMLKDEMEVSMQAGEIVGKLYDAFYAQMSKYVDMSDSKHLKALNKLCVRIVFCLYAEDAGLFGKKNMFHDYLDSYNTENLNEGLHELFKILDTKEDSRAPFIFTKAVMQGFPYVNGGLFEDDVPVPPFNEEMRSLLLQHAAEDFDWSKISPTIFGAVFESTLNPDTRRKGGMHYTSIENIHKVIDPLFLDELKRELHNIITNSKSKPAQKRNLEAFQNRLASLKFFDPAAGSGNFLTETYICLRLLENKVIRELQGGQMALGAIHNPIKVSIQQFYGIEINDFAVTVAKTALWIAESQMFEKTKELVNLSLDFLPLKTYTNIVEGNALDMDWRSVVQPTNSLKIFGNPPFVGHQWRSEKQNKDMERAFHDLKKHGKLDYVCCWYNKAADFIQNTNIQVAFVSTNSIVEGESVGILWKFLFEKKNISIDFAYPSFSWASESKSQATVHCVIIGFSKKNSKIKKLYSDGSFKNVKNINGYLLDAPNLFIKSRTKDPLFNNLPRMSKGSQPTDGGNLIINSEEEKNKLLKLAPEAEPMIRRYVGSGDFIKGGRRYCIWLHGISPSSYVNIKPIMNRIEQVREFRLKSPTESVRIDADKPYLFTQIRQPSSSYLAVPEVSSEKRKYIPIGYMTPDIIASNKLYLIPNASLYMFGVMISNVHMSWMRVVAGRLELRYSYSPAVYNNFPWPTPTDKQKALIEKTAQAILDARTKYSEISLSILYSEKMYMYPELLMAHRANDKAVMQAYGFWGKLNSESECVAELMKMYEALISENK